MAANADAEIRRLRVELDNKGSEVDTSIKEKADLRAELKDIRAMLHAAEQGADAAGADEGALRKRVSHLTCENGLLKGEKDRLEALVSSAEKEVKSVVARAEAEIERREREMAVQMERADRASALATECDTAKAALDAARVRLDELRQERTELQVRGTPIEHMSGEVVETQRETGREPLFRILRCCDVELVQTHQIVACPRLKPCVR